MRGITAAVSARTLLAMTEPIFTVSPRTTATFGPMPQFDGAQYAALAVQNPTFDTVTVNVALYAADGTLLHQTSQALAGRNRLALEASEWLDGIAPPAGTTVVVTASSPIDAIGLLCDEGAWTITPTLPQRHKPSSDSSTTRPLIWPNITTITGTADRAGDVRRYGISFRARVVERRASRSCRRGVPDISERQAARPSPRM